MPQGGQPQPQNGAQMPEDPAMQGAADPMAGDPATQDMTADPMAGGQEAQGMETEPMADASMDIPSEDNGDDMTSGENPKLDCLKATIENLAGNEIAIKALQGMADYYSKSNDAESSEEAPISEPSGEQQQAPVAESVIFSKGQLNAINEKLRDNTKIERETTHKKEKKANVSSPFNSPIFK